MNTPNPRLTHILFTASVVMITISLVLSVVNVATVLSAPQESVVTVPNLVGFEGFVADGSGNPIADGTYSITFKVYDAATGGTNLWTDTHSSVQVTKGLYSVSLGLGSGAPIPANLFNSNRWIGVTVGTGTEMTPRTRVSSVPFALNADHANTAENAITAGGLAVATSGANAHVLATDSTGNLTLSGSIRQSTAIGADVYNTGAYTITTGSSYQMAFDSEIYDTDNMFTPGNNYFTINSSGYYTMGCNIGVANGNQTGSRINFGMNIYDAQNTLLRSIGVQTINPLANTINYATVSYGLIYLSTGQRVGCVVSNTLPGSITLNSGASASSTNYQHAWIARIP